MKRLQKTAEAVRDYDAVHKKILENPEYSRIQDEARDKALLAVKEAFAEETDDINCRENAMMVHPDDNGWLRKRLVEAGHKDCGLTKEFRSSRGWGW